MSTKIDKYVEEIIAIAKDNSHGYSQYNRWGNPDYDCSALVITVVQNAGIPVKSYGATYTGNMYNPFIKCGFKDVTNTVNLRTGAGLKRGDILLNAGWHTEIYIGNGQMCGARIDEAGDIVGYRSGDQYGNEIAYGPYKNYPWQYVLRYVGDNTYHEPKKSSNKGDTGAKLIKYENWYGVTEAVCNVRSKPSTNAPIVATYPKNYRINYDSVYEANGYRWISYISWSGHRRYVAYRKTSGDTTPWITF